MSSTKIVFYQQTWFGTLIALGRANRYQEFASRASRVKADLFRDPSDFGRGIMYKQVLLLAGLCMYAAGASAHADTIGPGAPCTSCNGSTYTLTYTTVGTNTYDVSLVINATGYAAGDTLDSVSLKLVPQFSDITNLTVLSQPAGFSAPVPGGLSGGPNGPMCDGSGGGFFCTQSVPGVPVGAAGDTYTFSYMVTLASASDLLTGTGNASVKAGYLTATGKNGGITSEGITLQPGSMTVTPEPSSLILLGTGILGVAGALRRKLSV